MKQCFVGFKSDCNVNKQSFEKIMRLYSQKPDVIDTCNGTFSTYSIHFVRVRRETGRMPRVWQHIVGSTLR
jgi:hypothetical protein